MPLIVVTLFCVALSALMCYWSSEVEVELRSDIELHDSGPLSFELPVSSSDFFSAGSGTPILQSAARNIPISFSPQAERLRFEQISTLRRYMVVCCVDAITLARRHTLYYIYSLCKMRN